MQQIARHHQVDDMKLVILGSWIPTHMLHGTGIFTHIWLKFMVYLPRLHPELGWKIQPSHMDHLFNETAEVTPTTAAKVLYHTNPKLLPQNLTYPLNSYQNPIGIRTLPTPPPFFQG